MKTNTQSFFSTNIHHHHRKKEKFWDDFFFFKPQITLAYTILHSVHSAIFEG